MDFINRLMSTCISTCIVFTLLALSDVNAQPIELVGPNNKVAGKNQAATYGPVKPTDTLWRIAFNNRPDPKLSVDQVLIAIFMANPQAFKNNDIHSIIDGSTITIPSQSDIATITDAAAKLRIANNDQLKTNRPVVRQATPTVLTKPVEVIPEPVETFRDTTNSTQEELGKPVDDIQMNEMVDDSVEKVMPQAVENPGLSEQLALAMTDMQLLIKENQALKAQIKALDEKLAEMQTQEALDLQAHDELAELKAELEDIQLAKDMEHDSIFNNGWVIGTIMSLLSTGIMAGIFIWLLRRHKPAPQPEEPAKEVSEDVGIPDLETDDDLLTEDLDDDLLISDDDDLLEISDIDDLTDLDDDLLSSDGDDELLVPSDLDEIQLDDSSELPDELSEPQAEIAQEPADDGILAQDDLEALLAQADELEEEEAQGDPELSDEIVSTDDIDALLAQADELAPSEGDDVTSEDDIDALLEQANGAVPEDDIDALLESANETVDADDIDALLDGANETVDADDIDALLDGANETVDADDIDALLDGANETVDADDIDALLDGANETVDADDIDALIDGANDAVDVDNIDALLDGANAQVDADDIDALLAETDTLAEEDTIEPAADVASDDIDALLAETDTLVEEDAIEPAADVAVDDIDALLAETDTLVEEDAIEPAADVSVDDIDALLAETDTLVEEDAIEPAADVAVDDIDALLAETDTLVEEDAIEPAVDVASDDIDALLAETDTLVEEDAVEQAADVAVDDIDDMLTDMDSVLNEPDAKPPLSTLEQLSQLDQVEQPYLMTQDAIDETDIAESLAEISDEPAVPQTELSQAIEPLESFEQPISDIQNTDTGVPSELAPSQEAQHLVDALDNMLGDSDISTGEPAAQELDEFINPQAIALDDNDLTQSMAEFDEDSVIEPVADSSSKPQANDAMVDELDAFMQSESKNADIDLIDAEAELNEQLPKFEQENSFIDIDKLLDESAMNEQDSEPYQNVDLDIGLDEFPEMLPEADGIDVDDDPNGASKKLDLARAYLEIDDEDSARDMLEQVKQTGDSAQVKEVEKLMKRLK